MPDTDTTDKPIDEQDLNLVDDSLGDEEKDDAEIWNELDAADPDADTGEAADDSAAFADDALGDAASSASDDAGAATGEPDSTPDDTSGAAAPDTAAADETDPFAGASDEQRTAYNDLLAQNKKLEQSDRSQRGRLGAMQRQINELNEKLTTGAAPAADDSAAGASTDASGASEDVTDSEDWRTFESEYPEVAGPIKALVSDLKGQLTTQGKELAAIGSDRREEALSEQAELLEEEHDDWEEVMSAEELLPWLNEQPRHIQEAALRNAEEIVDAAEAADVVGRFKAFRSAQGSNTPNDADPAGDGKGKETTALTGKRKRQLESASTTRTGGPGAAAQGIPEDGDPEEIWKAMDRQERRQSQRA